MSNVPSIFAAPSGQGGNSTNTSTSAGGAYVPSAAASSYTPSAAASGYTPSAAATSGSGGGYVPSAAATSYTPSAAATSYTPSAAATSYTPSAAATSYTPSAAATSYTPSAAGTTSSYTPSAAASRSAGSTAPSAYVPSAAGAGAAPIGGGYTPSAAASAPTPPFSQALDLPPPPPQQQQQHPLPATRAPVSSSEYKPTAAGAGMATAPYGGTETPYATATALVNPSVYSHGSGPTHGVMTQASNPVKCHKLDYEIKGSEMQLVEVHLDPGETVIAEAGAMMYLEDDVDFKTKFGDGSEPKQGFFKKLMSAGGRILTGESLFITHFTNTGTSVPRIAAFAAPYPGTIIPIDMLELQQRYPSSNPDKPTSIICQKDAFLCAAKGTKLSMHFNRKLGSGFFGGEGFILQKLAGDGMAFCHAGGCVIKKEMKRGERLRVDTGCLVAFTSGIEYNITMAPGLKTMFFGGEGLFLATLQGEGTVWLQSLPFSRLADRVIAYSPAAGGRRQGEGGPLGGLGGMIDGDGFGRFQ